MNDLNRTAWAICLSLFIVGVLFDVELLRLMGGFGVIIFLFITSTDE